MTPSTYLQLRSLSLSLERTCARAREINKNKSVSVFFFFFLSPSPCFITKSHLLMVREAGAMVCTVCGQELMKRPNHTSLIMESSPSHNDGIERY